MEIKLSKTSKMNCNSWSTQALDTCPRGKELSMIDGSICSQCYACKGMYRFPSVKNRRIENYAQWQSDSNDWIDSMVLKINRTKSPLFRFFDSGDLTSVEQLDDIISVCLQCKTKQFWIPTRENTIIKNWLELGNVIPSNVNLRISADMVDDDETTLREDSIKMGCTTSRVLFNPEKNDTENICPATIDGSGNCGSCTNCWDKKIKVIVYKAH